MTGFGAYVHVPFCRARCDYCAFATWTDRFHLAGRYVAAVEREILQAVDGGMPPVSSVFFGGGTPSLLSPVALGTVLAALPRDAGVEVTVECNPETVDFDILRGYRDAGVTRLSFGVQSLVPAVLSALGRTHRSGDVYRAVEAAADAGFGSSYSVDLIYGAAGETKGDWETTVRGVLAFDPPPAHVSAYALTVEAGTPLAADPARHPDPDDQADKYASIDALLGEVGLEWYEISNWARPGAECSHNQLYWSQGYFRGFGCAAHSHGPHPSVADGARRWWNVRTPERYIRAIEGGRSPVAVVDEVRGDARRLESLQLALRTRRGVPGSALPGWAELPGLVAVGDGGRLVLTLRGRLLANEVALRLTP